MHNRDELELAFQDTLRTKNRLDGMLSTCPNVRLRTLAEEQALLGLINNLKDKYSNLHRLGTDKKLPSFFSSFDKKTSQILMRRVEKLVDDCKILILAAERELRIYAKQVQADRERETLLSTGGTSKQDDSNRRRTGGSGALNEAALVDEREKLVQSTTMIIGAIEQGRMSLNNLVNQRQLLQGSRKKLHNAFITAGVSASTLTSIEARIRSDKFITYVGIVAVTILIYLFFCWWTGIHVFWWFPSRVFGKIFQIIEAIWRILMFLPRMLLFNQPQTRKSAPPSVETMR